MELKFALVADHVTQTAEGKLVLVGEFDAIWSSGEPIVHGPFFLVARFEAGLAEGEVHSARIDLVDADGHHIMPPSPELVVQFVPIGPGYPLRGQINVRFDRIAFPKAGDYEFRIHIAGEIATLPIRVILAPVPPSADA